MLSRFAALSFEETFGPDNHPGNMAAYPQEVFSPAIQAAEIGEAQRLSSWPWMTTPPLARYPATRIWSHTALMLNSSASTSIRLGKVKGSPDC